MKKAIKVKVGSKEKAAKEFIDAWHRIESGDEVVSDTKLYFENPETLLKVLTPKRLELLRAIRLKKSISIRALAKLLERDYKNVHQDSGLLENIGLIEKTEGGLVTVPWETIITEIPIGFPASNDQKASTSKNTKKRRTR